MAKRPEIANAIAITKILVRLLDGTGYSVKQLQEESGLTDRTIYKWLNLWHKWDVVYIQAYVRNPTGGRYGAKFSIKDSEQRDAKYPRNQGTAFYSAVYRQKRLERKALHGIL